MDAFGRLFAAKCNLCKSDVGSYMAYGETQKLIDTLFLVVRFMRVQRCFTIPRRINTTVLSIDTRDTPINKKQEKKKNRKRNKEKISPFSLKQSLLLLLFPVDHSFRSLSYPINLKILLVTSKLNN